MPKGMKTSRANVSRVRGLFGAKAVKTSPTETLGDIEAHQPDIEAQPAVEERLHPPATRHALRRRGGREGWEKKLSRVWPRAPNSTREH